VHARNLLILVTTQLISATGSFVFVSLAGIIGAELASDLAWATLPVTVMVLATATTTVPASLLMRRFGRRRGFAMASLSAAVAAFTMTRALAAGSFLLFLTAAALFGINMAFTQQYRYAAAESVDTRHIPLAISFVLLGSIGGAFAGKILAARGEHWVAGIPYAGTMFALIALYVVQAVLFQFYAGVTPASAEREPKRQRRLPDIVRQPVFLVAVLGGTAGYGLMSLIMTATPLSMHVNDDFSLEQTTSVIRAHVLGMYTPSLVSGFLIRWLGVVRMMLLGASSLLVTSVIGMQGHAYLHYWWALVLLGVGWNLLYVGATTMLTYTYSITERFQAQAVNEFLVFGTAAVSSLLAGTIMHFYGWHTLMWVPIPVLCAVAIALIVVRKDALLQRRGSRAAA
jgi:MFS family permease